MLFFIVIRLVSTNKKWIAKNRELKSKIFGYIRFGIEIRLMEVQLIAFGAFLGFLCQLKIQEITRKTRKNN